MNLQDHQNMHDSDSSDEDSDPDITDVTDDEGNDPNEDENGQDADTDAIKDGNGEPGETKVSPNFTISLMKSFQVLKFHDPNPVTLFAEKQDRYFR